MNDQAYKICAHLSMKNQQVCTDLRTTVKGVSLL